MKIKLFLLANLLVFYSMCMDSTPLELYDKQLNPSLRSLRTAVAACRIREFSLLLSEFNGDISSPVNFSRETLLHMAASMHYQEERMGRDFVEFDLYTGVNVQKRKKYISMCNLLLEKGANPNANDPIGLTPLHYAAGKDLEACELLLKKGADVNLCTNDGFSPLHCAASEDLDICKLLVENGANIEASCNGITPLGRAVVAKKVEICEYLINKGARLDAYAFYSSSPIRIMQDVFLSQDPSCEICEPGSSPENYKLKCIFANAYLNLRHSLRKRAGDPILTIVLDEIGGEDFQDESDAVICDSGEHEFHFNRYYRDTQKLESIRAHNKAFYERIRNKFGHRLQAAFAQALQQKRFDLAQKLIKFDADIL